MKKSFIQHITFAVAMAASTFSFAQTALDFETDDCNGNPQHLYADLEAGKAVVLFYYMPNCGSCPPHATKIQTMANNINAEHPGLVKGYAYPYQNSTPCTYSSSWVVDNNLPFYTPMNNGATSLAHYGQFAMPTIVLLGGDNHDILKVYDQGFSTSDTIEMRTLILGLLEQNGLNELNENSFSIDAFPNPSSEVLNIRFNLKQTSTISYELVDLSGRRLFFEEIMQQEAGDVSKDINTASFPSGSYVLKINSRDASSKKSITIQH